MKSLLKKTDREELPNKGLKILSDVIGINRVKELIVKCPGHIFYVPKRVFRERDDEFITKNFDGKNAEFISEKIGLSVRTVYRRVKKLNLSVL